MASPKVTNVDGVVVDREVGPQDRQDAVAAQSRVPPGLTDGVGGGGDASGHRYPAADGLDHHRHDPFPLGRSVGARSYPHANRSTTGAAMRAFMVRLPSGTRYWTVLDEDLRPHPAADDA